MILSPYQVASSSATCQYRIHKPVCQLLPPMTASPLGGHRGPCIVSRTTQTSPSATRSSHICNSNDNTNVSIATLEPDSAVASLQQPILGKDVQSDASSNSTKIFSTLNPQTLKHEPGSILGSALLVAGTTVGAGILALPAVTQEAGFAASSAGLVGSCVYAIITGLLLAEVNINTIYKQGAGEVSIVSMASQTLGTTGTQITSLAYVFLHYCLLIAYISKAGEITADTLQIPMPAGAALFAAVLAGSCYACSPKLLDQINGGLVVLVVASFLGLVGLASGGIHPEALAKADWAAVPAALPVMALAFVYQNVVPVVVTNLEGDVGKIRSAICLGVAIPLLMFLSWEGAILGSLPEGASGVVDPLSALQASDQLVGPLIQGFSFLAIATSYIGFILGLTSFLADALQLPSSKSPATYGLTLVPPFLLAITYPDMFLKALDVAGTYGVMTIFGIIPAAMAWKVREADSSLPAGHQELVPGGSLGLAAVVAVAAGVIGNEVIQTVLGAAQH